MVGGPQVRTIPVRALPRVAWIAGAATVVVGVVYVVSSPQGRADITNLAVALAAWVATGLAVWRARAGPDHRPWRWLAAALVLISLGESYWAVQEVFLGQPVPDVSGADLLYYAGFALLFISVGIWMPRDPERGPRARRLFEALMLAAAFSVLSWALLESDVVAVTGIADVSGWIAAGYPIIGSLLISLFLILTLSLPRHRRRGPALLTLAFLAWAVADSAYAYQATHGSYESGFLFDLGWMVGDLLIGLAALAVADGRPGRLTNRVDRIFQPHPGLAGTPQRRAARLAAITSLTLLVILAAAVPIFDMVDPTPTDWTDDPADLIGVLLGVVLGILYILSRTRHALIAAYLIAGVLEVGLVLAAWFNAGSAFGEGSLFLLIVPPLVATFLISPLTGFALSWGNAGMALALSQASGNPITAYLAVALLIGVGSVMSIGATAWLNDLRATQRALALIEETQAIARVGSWEIDLATGKQHGTVENNRLFMLAPGEEETPENILRHIHPDDHADVAAVLARVPTTGREVTETRIMLPGGGLRWLRTHAIARYDGTKATRIVGYSQDVTEEKLHEAAAREADRLRDAAAFKTQFLNNAAHELANPLTPLRLQLATLRQHATSWTPAQQKSVDLLERNVNRLGLLVNDLLDAARLQGGRLRLTPAPTRLGPLVEATHGSLLMQAEASGLTLTVQVPAQDVVAVADENRLTQVLFNLTHNALKFTPRGGNVVLRLRQEGDAAILEVEDSGIGLEPEQIARLFEPFTQVHDASVLKVGGTGLGLYISRGIVEQHGGALHIQSKGRGQGSTFSVRLPLSGPPTAAAAPAPPT